MKYISHYILTLFIFVGIDFIWLRLTFEKLYKPHMSHLLADNTKLIGAILFYIVFVGVLVILGVYRGLEADSLSKAILYSSLLGLASYATYEFTNYATLKQWPLQMVIIDILWGVFISALVGGISYLLAKNILK